MKSFINIGIVLGAALLMTSCFNKSKPNYQFFPNMYESVGYETYQETDAFINGMEAQTPPDNTIKRGWLPFEYENTLDGKTAAYGHFRDACRPVKITAHKWRDLASRHLSYSICHDIHGEGTVLHV